MTVPPTLIASFYSPVIVPISLVSSVSNYQLEYIPSQPSLVVISWSAIPSSVPNSVIVTPVTILSGSERTVTISYVPSVIPTPINIPSSVADLRTSEITVVIETLT